MNKDDLSLMLEQVKKGELLSALVTVDDLINIYGDDHTRTINGKETGRADILAISRQLLVSKDNSNYTFTRAI